MKKLISVVVPCYNEQAAVPVFYRELSVAVKAIEDACIEVIFVDDGSKDGTLSVIKKLADNFEDVKYISFSRNFGKEAAMYAGMQAASGDYVCIMDVDLQDPPSMLPKMYEEIQSKEYDIVGARRVTRKGEPPIRSFFARMFYKLINKTSSTEIVDGARDFRLMTRQAADAVLKVGEYNRFSKGIMSWVGFKTKWLPYENVERVNGETKWSFMKLLIYSIDGITAFSTMPLSIASVLGLLFCAIAAVLIVVVVVKTLIWGDPVAGYPSAMCLMFLLSGVQLFTIGIIGQYLSKTYMEVKNRPIYITKESNIVEKI
ncbi:MAG: glycosyltransferase family 2 protein [Clostridiales bacterium]|nr:glycosyltransferase family 2 protein [Clostridiales bacterium]